MRIPHLLPLLTLLPLPAANALVTSSTLGPNHTYNPAGAQSLFPPYEWAISFTPAKTVNLTSLSLPLESIGNGPNYVTLTLSSNSPANTPGQTLDSWTIPDLINFTQNNSAGTLYTLTGLAPTLLSANSTYWLRTAPDGSVGWFTNSIGVTNNYLWTTDGGATWQQLSPNAPSGALEITGLVPGDLNDDSLLTPDDYALLDRGYARHLTTRPNGDLNYDGVINPNDYLLLDTLYLQQHPRETDAILTTRSSQFGADYITLLTTSLPEPTPLLAACGLAFLPRRQRPQ